MKIKTVKDTEAFFKTIDSCVGTVELITAEGDRLNLKSKLSQFLSLANIFALDSNIPGLELIAYEPEDMVKISKFLEAQE